MLGTVTLKMEATALNCSSCSQPLKPRWVYKCVDIPLFCHRYVRKIMSYQKCKHPSSGFTHEPAMDAVLSATMVECAHKGCSSLLPYYELHEHEITRQYAPCMCTETGCNFAASPPALIAHLEAVHSIQVNKIQYATTKAFQELVPLSSEASSRVILVGEQDGAMFVLTIGMVSTVPLVSTVYVKAAMCDLTVELDASSSAKLGDIAFEDFTSYLAAPLHYLVGPCNIPKL